MRLIARPLEAAAFAPFGHVNRRPPADARTRVGAVGPAENRRGAALPRLGWFRVPASAWPVTLRQMERHRFSSQSFLPCGPAPWMVVVAPGPLPDMTRALAFVAGPEHAVTLRPNVWHHPLTALADQDFAVLTFLAGDEEDEQFVDIAPIEVTPAT